MLLAYLIFIPAAASLFCLVIRSRPLMEWANILAFAATLVLALALGQTVLAAGVLTEWDGFFYADALSAWMVLLISAVSLGASLYAGGYFRRDVAGNALTPGRVKEYFVLTPLFSACMFFAVLANNLGVMWFAIEATALSSVLLVALYNRKTSLEAAWKYVMLGGLGLALALFGTVFTYAAAIGKGGAEPLPSFDWSHFMTIAGQLNPRMIKLAFVFVLIGYGAKAGLAPMHTWLPDAHSEAPSPTSAMLSGISLKVAIYALLRFHILAMQCLGPGFSRALLLCFGLFSMFLAAPFILVQGNLKRMLAYSSLEHVGLICSGVGLGTPLTLFGALLHMGYHALTKPALFFAAGNIHQRYHSMKFRVIGPGVIKTLPVTVLFMGLAAAAIVGLPPFGLFYSELTILSGAVAAHRLIISFLILAALVAVFCGVLKQLSRILIGEPPQSPSSRTLASPTPVPPVPQGELGTAPKRARANDRSAMDGVPAMGLLIAALLLFSLWLPAPLLHLLQKTANLIGGKA
ncbi:MAG: hydrogenase 4 subunit F [Verrucomicrobia bacterium]|nr:hydrogenase 4 subunit F [Verrucomicrobiota bacterium]MDE3100392.1 hydrogenase 4 subunit F [Verrucomicrobiota bacterium]